MQMSIFPTHESMMGGSCVYKCGMSGPLGHEFRIFTHLCPPTMDSRVGNFYFVYYTVKYSNSAYFLGHAIVYTHSLRTYTVVYSTRIYSHYVTDEFYRRLENQ